MLAVGCRWGVTHRVPNESCMETASASPRFDGSVKALHLNGHLSHAANLRNKVTMGCRNKYCWRPCSFSATISCSPVSQILQSLRGFGQGFGKSVPVAFLLRLSDFCGHRNGAISHLLCVFVFPFEKLHVLWIF